MQPNEPNTTINFVKPLGPDTAGFLEKETYIDPELLTLLWRNEIANLATQIPPFLMDQCKLTTYQIINLFIFFTVQISQQILTDKHEKARDLLNFYTQQAFNYFTRLEREGVIARFREEPDGAAFLFSIPGPLSTEEKAKLLALAQKTPPFEN